MEKRINVTKGVFNVGEFDQLPIDEIKEYLANYNFACIRGLINPEDVKNALRKMQEKFSRQDDNPVIGEANDAVRSHVNYQKLLLGEVSQTGGYASRFFRTIYNPMWQPDIYGMKETVFRKMVIVRNRLINREDEYASEKIEDNGMWTATRVHQYPIGGGYFSAHKDFVIVDASDKAGEKEFYHIIVNMTKKGIDFETGGGYVEINEERYNLDDIFEVGDIIIYDRNSIHGVEEVDPHKKLEIDTFNGRVTAFVSLYKAL